MVVAVVVVVVVVIVVVVVVVVIVAVVVVVVAVVVAVVSGTLRTAVLYHIKYRCCICLYEVCQNGIVIYIVSFSLPATLHLDRLLARSPAYYYTMKSHNYRRKSLTIEALYYRKEIPYHSKGKSIVRDYLYSKIPYYRRKSLTIARDFGALAEGISFFSKGIPSIVKDLLL